MCTPKSWADSLIYAFKMYFSSWKQTKNIDESICTCGRVHILSNQVQVYAPPTNIAFLTNNGK